MILRIILLFFALIALMPDNARATSLDGIYRDIIRSNNSGYLPLFVKNRRPLDILLTEEDVKDIKFSSSLKSVTPDVTVKLSSDLDKLDAIAKARYNQWLKTVAAVKSNQVTPVELDEIYSRVRDGDAKATEILACMYAKGVGVAPDFVEAFNLYKQAALLNVANAERNALIVYKAMNETQRRQVKNRF